jgi:hypothetical protein
MKQLTDVRLKRPGIHAFLGVVSVALFSATFSFVQPAAADSRAAIPEAIQLEVIKAHNAVRSGVARAESQRLGSTVEIPNLLWSDEVAAVAQDWANQQAAQLQQGQARPEHRSNNSYGENMYWAWSTSNQPDLSPTAAITSWSNEQRWYNYDANACAANQECGHYTQLVWNATRYVGCGQAMWSQDDKNYVLWVCNYAPASNILGQRPYSAKTNCPYNWTRWLQLGSQGPDVIELKSRLNVTGANLGVGSYFDDATHQAVVRFQADRNLTVDGIVGPQTQSALNSVCPKYKKLRPRG